MHIQIAAYDECSVNKHMHTNNNGCGNLVTKSAKKIVAIEKRVQRSQRNTSQKIRYEDGDDSGATYDEFKTCSVCSLCHAGHSRVRSSSESLT